MTLLFLISFGSFAQVNQQAKAYFSTTVTDTAFVQNTRTSLQSLNGNSGALYFDKSRNKWRVWNGSAYVDLISTSTAISNVTGSNAITVTGTTTKNVAWGGTLTETTSINGAQTLNFGNTTALSSFNITASNGGTFSGKYRFPGAATNIVIDPMWGLDLYLSTARNHITYAGIAGDSTHNYTVRNGANVFLTMNPTASTGTTLGGKFTFTPTTTYEGINVGSVTANPSGRANGAVWYRSDLGQMFVRAGGSDVQIAPAPTGAFWPLTGSASLTGSTTIDLSGNNLTLSDNTGGLIGVTTIGNTSDTYAQIGAGVSQIVAEGEGSVVGLLSSQAFNSGGTFTAVNSSSTGTTLDITAANNAGNQSARILFNLDNVGGDPQGVTFTQTGYTGGIKYAADYSSTYTTRTLVDKAYVDVRVLSGNYSPTLTGITNVTTVNNGTAYYSRSQNVVTVFGECFIDPAATGNTVFAISLPISSTISSDTDLNGTGKETDVGATVGNGAWLKGNTASGTNTARVTFIAADASNHQIFWSFMYIVH